MSNTKLAGFTQSQTLLVTGFVFLIIFAMIAVPFYNSCKKKQMVTKLRKLQASLLQADKMSSQILAKNYEEYNTTLSAKDFAERYFVPYLEVDTKCTKADNDCWNEIQYKDLAGNEYTNKIGYSVKLNDKTVVGFSKDKNGLISIIADLDGKAGSNTLGYDVFVFYIYNDKYQPKLCDSDTDTNIYIKNGIHMGGYDKCGIPLDTKDYKELFSPKLPDGCNKDAPRTQFGAGTGAACAALIYKSSWNMDSVYPW